MKKASAKFRRKIKNKFVSAILRISAVEEQRERSMRMRHGRKRAAADAKKVEEGKSSASEKNLSN